MLGIIGRDAKRIFWNRLKPPMIDFVVHVRIVYFIIIVFFLIVCTQQKQTVVPMVSAVFPEKVLGSCTPQSSYRRHHQQTEVAGGSIGIIGMFIMFFAIVY